MTNTNHPNPFSNFFPAIKLERYIPTNITIINTVEKMIKNYQSIAIFSTSPMNPIRDFTAIINKEVATAFFMGNLANSTNAGDDQKSPSCSYNSCQNTNYYTFKNKHWITIRYHYTYQNSLHTNIYILKTNLYNPSITSI